MDRELSIKLTWIHGTVSEKPELTDDGRLRHDSSSAWLEKRNLPPSLAKRSLFCGTTSYFSTRYNSLNGITEQLCFTIRDSSRVNKEATRTQCRYVWYAIASCYNKHYKDKQRKRRTNNTKPYHTKTFRFIHHVSMVGWWRITLFF